MNFNCYKKASGVVLGIFMLLPFTTLAQPLTGRDVVLKQQALDQGFHSETSTGKMTIVSRSGVETVRRFKSFVLEANTSQGKKTLTKIISPADLNGVGLLSYQNKNRDDDQWIYLPALKKTKRIAGTSRGGRFIGSDFSYEDLSPRDVDDYSYKLLREEFFGESPCYVIEAKPLVKDTAYSRHVLWIQKDGFRTAKIDLYNLSGTLYKTGVFEAYKKISNHFWRAYKITMSDSDKGRKTVLEVEALELGVGLKDADFTLGVLER